MSDREVLEKAKQKTKELIEIGEIELAKELVDKYKDLLKDDVDIYSIRGIIAMIEGEMRKAEEILLEGYIVDNNNFDLLYNLGYLYGSTEKHENSFKFYTEAKDNCNDEEVKKELSDKIDYIKNQYKLEEKIQENIVFFVKEGMDTFLGDIINELSKHYIIKKVIVKEYNQIDKWMEWADICWFEWCDDLVIYGSKLLLSREKKIICRIHGYEVYTNSIINVNWENVDNLIVVAPHIRRIFEENIKDISKGNLKIDTIFCGVNVDKYPLNNKVKGFNLGYLGYINYKKNIPLTLDIFKKLHDIDNRYKLHLAGAFQDDRTLSYLKYFIKEHKLEDSFIFHGWLNDIEKRKWFETIDYMIISSIDEGLCFASAESMCSGIKPILHNCEGIKDHYDKKYIFNTIDEAVDMIQDENYDSKEYREFIEKNYSLGQQTKKIIEVLNGIVDPNYYSVQSNLDNKNNYRLEKNYYLKDGEQLEYYMNPWVFYNTNTTYIRYEVVLNQIQNQLKYINELYFNGESNINAYSIYFNYLIELLHHNELLKEKNIINLFRYIVSEGELNINIIEKILICIYPILKKKFKDRNNIYTTYKMNDEYKNKRFSNDDKIVKELYDKLFHSIEEIGQFVKTFIVHGSLSTLDYTKYSDVDTLIILKNEVFESIDNMRICRKRLSKAAIHLFEYDPLQHHKFFFVTEMDLMNYPKSYLPVELFEYSTLVYGDIKIEISIRESLLENLYAVWSMAYGFRQTYLTKQFPNNLFSLKRYTSRLMLLPTLYLELFKDIYPYKKYSFDLAKKYFTEEEWRAIEIATMLRKEWNEIAEIDVNNKFYYYTWKLAEKVIDSMYNNDLITIYLAYLQGDEKQ